MSKISCLSGFQLKIIAIITMTIDHMGAILYPQYYEMRIIGRIAFPIYAFLLVEGMVHTKDIQKYLKRLGIFALISEIPFDLVFHNQILYLDSQNIFFTLLFGGLAISLIQDAEKKAIKKEYWKYALAYLLSIAAEYFCTDYGMIGVWLILGIYLCRGVVWKTVSVLAVINTGLYGGIQSFGTLAAIPIALYNGERGYNMKYFFYVYYPIHLLILYGVSHYCM